MNEQNWLRQNQNNKETGSGEIRDANPMRALAILLRKKELSSEMIIESAKKTGKTVIETAVWILGKVERMNDFVSYINQFKKGLSWTEADTEKCILSFIEKIQQPEKTEEVAKPIEIPEIPTEPEIPPVEIPEPATEIQPIPEPAITEPESRAAVSSVETFPKPEMKNWWEVKRETEVMAVEDLSGSMKTFEEHVAKLGVAKKDASGKWQWTGENKKLVFLGDILGDRDMDGMKITNTIFDLAEQAEKKGGQVDFICGNHDEWLIDFLCNPGRDKFGERVAGDYTGQANGIWELAQFDPSPKSKLKKISPELNGEINPDFEKDDKKLWQELYEKIPEILIAMKNNQKGRKVLENICRTKVAVIHDDTLFCHTDPTHQMITDLLKSGDMPQRVAEINKIFQENLQRVLFDDGKLDDDFRKITDIYLRTGNREYFVERESFDKLADNLLSKVLEYLHKTKQIKFNQEAEEKITKKGYKNIKWENWEFYVSRNLIDFNANLNIEGDVLKGWGKENEVAGDYIVEIGEILNKLIEMRGKEEEEKREESENLYKLVQSLVGKIENLNPAEDKVKKVRKSGINTIIHGHTPKGGRSFDKNNFVIITPHSPDFEGISIIQRNGKIELASKSFRKQRP